jgi:RNA polymerase sigma factor (sigma-70 family)
MRRVFALGESDPEEVFLRHYDALIAYALQLESDRSEQAEDLVHDAFVALSLGQINLDSAKDVRTYLCGVLRHFHVSRVRRAVRRPTVPLALLQYDSLALAVDARVGEAANSHEELLRILRCVCRKKAVSKSGSVLILRFFHGFYPAEIARIILATRREVDQWLWLARKEIARELDAPGEASCTDAADRRSPVPAPRAPDWPSGELSVLRATILSYASGPCLLRTDLRRFYGDRDRHALPTAVLSHMVSCPPCLDAVCRILGLDPLDDRSPTDTIGPDRSGGNGEKRGNTKVKSLCASASARSRLERRVRDVREHRPRQLRLLINGFPLATQAVTSGRSLIEVSGRAEESVSSLEVVTEQEVRLLFLAVEPPPDGDLEQSVVARLSDDRTIRLQVRLTELAPAFVLEYEDPHWEGEPSILTWPETETEFELLVAATKTEDETEPEKPTRLREFVRWRGWLRPAGFALSGVLSLIALIAYLSYRPTSASADTLLQRSSLLEATLASRKDVVLHRTFRIESRRPSTSGPVASHKVEVWESAAKGSQERRLYDAQDRLLSTEWSTLRGTTTPDPDHSTAGNERILAWMQRPDPVNNVLRHGPSASDLARLTSDPADLSVKGSDDTYEIGYKRGVLETGAGIVRATVVLRKTDLRAIRETLVWRQPDGQEHEIALVEVGFEPKPSHLLPRTVFLPELRPHSPQGGLPAPLPPAERAAPRSMVTFAPTPIELAASEIEVRGALHRIGADLGEQINISRTAAQVEVSGVLVSPERKRQVTEVLAGIPHTRATLRVVEEGGRRVLPRQRFAWSKVTQPSRAPLSQILKQRFPRTEEREAFVVDVLDRAQEAYGRAWALRRLAERYDATELALLDRHQTQALNSLIQDHSGALRVSVASLKSDLQPLLSIAFPPEDPAGANANVSDWQQEVFNAFGAVQQIYQSTIKLLTSSDPVARDSEPLERNLLQAFLKSSGYLQTLGVTENATDVAGAYTR